VLLWDTASFERRMSFRRKGIGVESYEGIFRAMSFEGMVEREEPGKVSCVRYESCPDYFVSTFFIIFHVFRFILTFIRLCDPVRGRHIDVKQFDKCLEEGEVEC
jgi:hypothetical protein